MERDRDLVTGRARHTSPREVHILKIMGNSDYGGGYYDGYDGVDRSRFAEKSAAAQRRENAAKAAFDAAKTEVEEVGETATVELLKPNCHLTNACWSSFSKVSRVALRRRQKKRPTIEPAPLDI